MVSGDRALTLDQAKRIAVRLGIPSEQIRLGGGDIVAAGGRAGTPHFVELDRLRLGVDQILSDGTSPTRIDLIEERIASHVAIYTRMPPGAALNALVPDLHEARTLASIRQPARTQVRLSASIALLALLAADALMKLGETARAMYWYGTARLAADDSGDRRLRALARAQEAMLPFYFGRMERVVDLARAAQGIAPSRHCDAVGLAAAAEARALARLGDRSGAEAALARATEVVDARDAQDDDRAFQFTAKRLLLYSSGAVTYLGDLPRARHIQRQALDLYHSDPNVIIDPALVHLDAATCHAIDGAIGEACDLAVRTITELPAEHRTRIVLAKATAITRAIPARLRGYRAVDSLRELVADTNGNGT